MCVSFFYTLFTRSRSSCETYKQLLSDAMNQLKNMNKAAVMSNNQSNQFDRLSKAVEQVMARPIWTPNTTRHQQAELVEQLRKELNKVMMWLRPSNGEPCSNLLSDLFYSRNKWWFCFVFWTPQNVRAKYESRNNNCFFPSANLIPRNQGRNRGNSLLLKSICDRPFVVSDHMVQKPPWWVANWDTLKQMK